MKSIKDVDVNNKRVLMRADFNVPLDEQGNILDDFRIRAVLPTINYLLDKGAKVVLMSHLGEPDGKVVPELRMDKVREKLSELLGGDRVMLLENLRFNKGEAENDENFAKELAKNGDIYMNEAFSVCHRKNASVCAITKYLPSCAGLVLQNEINALDKVLGGERPLVAVIGGKKVETKAKFIERFSGLSEYVIVSGLIKHELESKKMKFSENVIGPSEDLLALDVEESFVNKIRNKILEAKTVIWNGPFGKTEDAEHEKGTLAIAEAIIQSKAFSVAGGGETVEFIRRKNLLDKFSHVSTGGGAMLSYLAGEKLPGIEALNI